MEKLLIRVLILLISTVPVLAQDSLVVFALNGPSFLKMDASLQQLNKGVFLNKSTVIQLQQSEITAIDNLGEAYKISGSGDYAFNQILKNKVLEKRSSMTAKYFKVIWDELLNKENGKTVIGGVFRGEIPMLYPSDSAQVVNRTFRFKWEKLWDSDLSYFFLRNVNTDETIKIATTGEDLILYNDQHIFKNGNHFEWTVSGQAFPNLKNLPFNTFEAISREAYEQRKAVYKKLINDLKSIGLDEIAISKTLCETYGLCK